MHQIIPRSSQKLHQRLETGGTNNKTFGWIIMSSGKENDSSNLDLAQKTAADYEQVCTLDVFTKVTRC